MRSLIAFCLLLLLVAPAAAQEVHVEVQTALDGSRSLIHQTTVSADIDAVWEAVGTVDGWRTWAVPLARPVPGVEDRFETGYNPAAEAGAPDTIEQQWIVREPPHRAVFRTSRTPDGFPHGDVYTGVTSEFSLTPGPNSTTEVRLTTRGYPPGEAGDVLIGFFRDGNRMTLEQLQRRFISGPIDWTAQAER